MLVDPQSHGLILNPEVENQRLATYSTTSLQGQQYRVLTRQYKCHSTMISMWTVFWLFLMLTLASFIFVEKQQIKPILVLFFIVIEAIVQTAFVWMQRKYLNNLVLIVTLSWLVYAVSTLVVVICQVQLITVPTLLFSCFLILVASMKVKNKGRVVFISILLVQLSLISAKLDNLIDMSWQQILILLLPISLLSLSSLVFLSLYSLILRYYYLETFIIKKYSLMFLILNFLGICAILGFILGQVYFQIPIRLSSILSSSLISTVTLYLFIYDKQIAVAFCRHKQIVDGTEKQTKIELLPQKKEFYPELFRYSENWFGREEMINQQTKISEDLPECIVCTDSKCEVVWLPCGHLITCSSCCQDMLQNLMLSCVLCKQRPNSICKLDIKDVNDIIIEQQLGISEQKKNRKYNVAAMFEIKSVP